ncbi:MAG: hypothetical protein IKF39_02150 [Oscillospiraceae bacterium]|nr:hypothetical protein [Oscillospiraceae bacterium]
MNKQRKVLITVTYNEMGIIIDTKAEEVAQPNLQPICNQLATDTISKQAAIDALGTPHGILYPIRTIEELPSADAQPVKHGCWIDKGGDIATCSICGGEPYYSGNIHEYKYCPYCGARMDGEEK